MWEIIATMPRYRKGHYAFLYIKRDALEQMGYDPENVESYCFLCEEHRSICEECPVGNDGRYGLKCGDGYEPWKCAVENYNDDEIRKASQAFLDELREKLS
jgi:hypothetical protein